jgi:hypothetical protein
MSFYRKAYLVTATMFLAGLGLTALSRGKCG